MNTCEKQIADILPPCKNCSTVKVFIDYTKDKQVYKIGEEIYDITNGWTMQTAYEANKKSQTCVVCGKALTLHPAVGVMYCSCVDKLPKE